MARSATLWARMRWGTSCTAKTGTCPYPSCVPTARSSPPEIFSAGAQERARATDTYVSYCGRYEFRGDTVVHHVELSLFPNWVGVEQERLVEVKGDRLTLSTRPILLEGVQRTAHLIWEAVGTSKQ